MVFKKKIFRLESVSSTQEVLKEQFQQGAVEGTVIAASEQTLGRGRQGHSWDSPAGKGLWTSILIVPEGPEEMWGWASLWAGVVIRNAIGELVQNDEILSNILLKWPNDLMWSNRKLGGILAEVMRDSKNRQAIALGIGINVLQHEQDFVPHLRGSAISLREITGERFTPDALLEQVILSAEEMIPLLKPVDPIKIKSLWLASAWALNDRLCITQGDSESIGVFTGLGEHGEIILKQDDGTIQNIASSDGIRRTITE